MERTENFSDVEFNELDRHTNGDIINLSMNFMWLTLRQRIRVTSDDFSRIEEYEEEVRIMMNEE